MNPRGISIAGLMGLVLVIGLGVAALQSSSNLWTSVASTLVLALFLRAVLGAIYLNGPQRAYWTGFALFGGVYLILVNWSWIGGQFGVDLTSALLEIAERAIPDPRVQSSGTPNPPIETTLELSAIRMVKMGNFGQISRLCISLVLALLGGYTARSFVIRNEQADRGNHALSASRNEA